ncbi:MAG TPA: peroxidase-related enzyme [Blastococcus sp.]
MAESGSPRPPERAPSSPVTAGTPVSRFPVPAREDLPAELRERFAAVEERSGFLPNVFAALSFRPTEAAAFFTMHDALMDKETPGLSKADRETVVVATSAANDCLYCVVAHGAVLRIRARDPHLADQVAVDWRKAPLSARMHAVLAVAVRLATAPAEVTPADLAGLREHGLTEDDVWDVGAIVSLFALSNRLAHWAAIPPNDEFFLMGRVAKA